MSEDELRHIYDVSLFNISDLDVLLHEILKNTRELLHAEAGSIYINNRDYLKFHVFQNDAFTYEEIYNFYYSFKDFKFPLSQHDRYLAVDSFLRKKIIVVDDVYNNKDYDFIGIKEFDAKFKYKTNSIITAPLIHPIENKVLGVVQLINKKDENGFIKFSENDKEILSMFSSFISLSISKAQNDVKKLQELNTKLQESNEILETKIEEELINSQDKSSTIFHQSKMASMGQIIGNIASKWREPLNTISTVASGITLDLEFGNFKKENTISNLNKIVDTTKSLSHMIDEFKSFYNVDTIKENFNVEDAIKKSLELSNDVLSQNNIKVIKKIDSKIEANGLKNEFVQSLLNLIIHAKNNIVKNISINEKRLIFIDLFKEEKNIIIKITDSSGEVDDSNVKKIFEEKKSSYTFADDSDIDLFMTRLIIENYMYGNIDIENISYNYESVEYKGGQITITLA